MKYLKVNDAFNHSSVDILVINAIIETSYDLRDELLRKFSEESDLPIIMVGGFRDCSMFYRLRTPFEIADKDHEVVKNHQSSLRYMHKNQFYDFWHAESSAFIGLVEWKR